MLCAKEKSYTIPGGRAIGTGNRSGEPGTFEKARSAFEAIVSQHGLAGAEVSVRADPLSVEEAIGKPGRKDFPIVEGREKMVEAVVLDTRGQAFTDAPGTFSGTMDELFAMPLDSNGSRALFLAAMNATLRALGMMDGVIHCRNGDPERCGGKIASQLEEDGWRRVALVGLNPAIAEALAAVFGCGNVQISDLDRRHIHTEKCGIAIRDGRSETEEMIRLADLVLVTGTTLVNDTFDGIFEAAQKYGTSVILYGVTAAGVCRLLGLKRICPYGQNGFFPSGSMEES